VTFTPRSAAWAPARIEHFLCAARAEGGVRCLATGRKFRIAFGCSPGPMVGDGGAWDVTFERTAAC
jgi:hypothetical protein